MKKLPLFALAILLLGFSACSTPSPATQPISVSNYSNGPSQMTHPVFDIKNFDQYRFDETSPQFNFSVESAVSEREGRQVISYLLVITPKDDEKIENIVVTASVDPKWLEVLTDKNRNTLYFGTKKDEPFNMQKGSSSEKGLISDIRKDLQDETSLDKVKDYLKLPIKILVKFPDKTSSFTVSPTKISFFSQDITGE